VTSSTVSQAGADGSDVRVGKVMALAAVVGVLASLAAVVFMAAQSQLQKALWTTLPDRLGWSSAPWFWVLGMLLIGAAITWAACRLPGHGGHHPLDDMAFNITPRMITSVVLAALATLAFGAVLGPEAPVMAIGTATAALLFRGDRPGERQILLAAGGVAAMGLILGNPLITAILVLEGATLKGSPGGRAAMSGLMPVMVALGFGYVVQVGVGNWAGFGESVLAVPGLPAYPHLEGIDILVGFPLAIVVALLAVMAHQIAQALAPRASARPLPVILMAATVIAMIAVAATTVTDLNVDTVLFSGQSAIGEILTVTSLTALVVTGIAKVIAYGMSLGAGFRGGQIFPAVFIGVVSGTAASVLAPEVNLSAMVACGIAAGAGAMLRLPFTSALLAVLLCADAGMAVTTTAIIGSVVGILVRVAADTAAGKRGDERHTVGTSGGAA
jgi:H+/Cl- antiporter ClcA